ncbi:MAG: hypothetical protein ACI4BA_05070 [Prevotella sp.]
MAETVVDVFLVLIYVLLAAVQIAVAVSMVHAFKVRGEVDSARNGVPAKAIMWSTAVFFVVLLALTYAVGSANVLQVNGKDYQQEGWLKVTDMFINAAITLVAVAVVLMILGVSGLNRKLFKSKSFDKHKHERV